MDANSTVIIRNKQSGEKRRIGISDLSLYGLSLPSQSFDQSPQFTPSASSMDISSNLNNVFSLIQKYFPQDQWQNALKVMQGESGGNPGAIGDNYPIRGQTIPSYGLFQIRALPGRPKPEQLMDPEFNVKYAANMFKEQGWRPWTVARKLGLVKG